MKNPISETARGWLYVTGVVLGAVIFVAVELFKALGLEVYIPTLAAAASALTMVVSTLARSHLSSIDTALDSDYVPRHSAEG